MGKYHIKLHFWPDKTLRTIFIVSVGIFLVSLIFSFFFAPRLAEPIVLKFDNMRGITMFGESSGLFGIWLAGFCIAILNSAIGNYLFLRERGLAYLFLSVNILIGILIFVAIALVASIN